MTEKAWFRVVIRILETLLCSVIPSAACLYILTKMPNVTLWKVLCAVSFVICVLANGVLWYFDNVNVKHNFKRYFVVNGGAYAIFAVAAYAVYILAGNDRIIYSACFACLRSFEEIFTLRVSYSMAWSHVIMLAEMIIMYFGGYKLYLKRHAAEVDPDIIMENDKKE